MFIEPLLRALADPTRLRMMRLLAHMELAVGELAQVLGQSQPRVSRHIRILCDAGLAKRRKEGSWVFLNSAIGEGRSDPLAGAAGQLLAVAELADPDFAARCSDDRRHLAAIRAARETTAASYFARHAEQWDTLRALHRDDGAVEDALLNAIGADRLGSVLDVGTGTGRIAELIAASAQHVTAFDKSPEMLRVARARLQHLPGERVALAQGDFSALPFADAAFDTVLFHQVLHYAQEPEAVLAEAARVTRAGGRIAIADFAAHEHEDLRRLHAHARLGFGEAQMAALLNHAGFDPAPARALPGSELTVMIWTGIRRAPSATGNVRPLRKAAS